MVYLYKIKPVIKNGYARRLIQFIVILNALVFSYASFVSDDDYKLKAAYLYQFTKFTQWPVDLFSDQEAAIRICVLGRNPFGKTLESFSSKVSQGRNLSVEYMTSLQQITRCHVVFISKSEEKRLPEILQRIEFYPVLSVSDMEGFARSGGIIGFVPKKRKIGLEINVDASRNAGAKLSSKLLEVANLVQGKLKRKIP